MYESEFIGERQRAQLSDCRFLNHLSQQLSNYLETIKQKVSWMLWNVRSNTNDHIKWISSTDAKFEEQVSKSCLSCHDFFGIGHEISLVFVFMSNWWHLNHINLGITVYSSYDSSLPLFVRLLVPYLVWLAWISKCLNSFHLLSSWMCLKITLPDLKLHPVWICVFLCCKYELLPELKEHLYFK